LAGELAYTEINAETIRQSALIVNTTPLGMFPDTDAYPPIPYDAVTKNHLLYDLIYNPAVTQFLSFGLGQGAIIKNGLEMLELQAEASWDLWNRA
jgi:shikimate dehydrogenase